MTRWTVIWLGWSSLLSGCAMIPTLLPPATDLLGSESHVVVVGKFELDPPLNAALEQRTHRNVIGDKRILNRIIMATRNAPGPVDTNALGGPDWQGTIEAEWGVPFRVKAPRQRTYLNGGFVQLDVVAQEKLWFPGGVYFDVPPGARAIYIGTLRYTRNEFNRITNVEVIDERKDFAPEARALLQPALLQKHR